MSDYPDIQLLFSGSSHAYKSGVILSRSEDVKPDISTALYKNILKNYTYEIYTILLRPRSRGHIKLKTTNPAENPEIFPNYFNDPHDLQVLVRYLTHLEFVSLIYTIIFVLTVIFLLFCTFVHYFYTFSIF